MNITITADVGDDDRVLLVPKHGSDYAKVGTVADVGASACRAAPGQWS